MDRLLRTRARIAALCMLIVVGITVPGAAAVPGEGTYVLDSMASTASWSGEVAAGVSARGLANTSQAYTGVTVTVRNQFIPGDDDPYPVPVVIPLVVQVGNNVLHLNRDLAAHNMTSVDRDENGDRYFAGQTVGQSQATVVGTAHLAPGDYPFVCTVHSEFMQGTLSVV